MAAARKLQAEIDRTLKKVQEGIDVFDEIWEKVHDTENANQKEKFEADLKTAIKKLQRHRDQIKTWISSADIKDKTVLVEARKSIEREMERFKVCEKEAKTKAFSKAGLGLADKLDPKEEAKAEAKDWVNNVVSTLQVQVEELEYELEELQANVKKKQKPPPRATRIEECLGRHKEHMTRLEQVLRCLDNETISPEDIQDLREDVDTYLSGSAGDDEQELDYEHVDDMYAAVLDKLEAVDSHLPVSAAVPKHPRGKTDKKKADSLDDDDSLSLGNKDRDKDKEREKDRVVAAAVKLQLGKGRSTSIKLAEEEESEASTKSSAPVASTAASPVPPLRQNTAHKESTDASPATTPSSATTPTPAPQRPAMQWTADSKPAPANPEDTATPSAAGSGTITANGNAPGAAIASDHPPSSNGQASHSGAAPHPAWIPARSEAAGSNPVAAKPSASSSISKAAAPTVTAPSPAPAGPSSTASTSTAADAPTSSEPNEASTSKPSESTPGLLKLPVLDPSRTGKSLEFQLGQVLPSVNPQLSLQIIDNVHSKSMPHPNDADWNSKRFRPRYPVNTPASYPRVAPDVIDNPALFRKMDPEALFFAFYYQPDTYQQYLAAQELKRQSWRYHKVHNAWFQRYAEPSLTTEEYEQGTYVYFDYNIMHDDHQTGWCYRRKENFTFRYDALEDELQVLPA